MYFQRDRSSWMLVCLVMIEIIPNPEVNLKSSGLISSFHSYASGTRSCCFQSLEKFRFDDGPAFDRRGVKYCTDPPTGKLADSNQRSRQGLRQYFSVRTHTSIQSESSGWIGASLGLMTKIHQTQKDRTPSVSRNDENSGHVHERSLRRKYFLQASSIACLARERI